MKFAIWALLLLAMPAAAAEVVVPIDSVSEHVNVRMEADPKSEIVGHLRQGENLPFQRTVPGWHEVALAGGAYGYVSSDWSLVISEEEFAARAEAAAAEETAIENAVAEDVDEAPADVVDEVVEQVAETVVAEELVQVAAEIPDVPVEEVVEEAAEDTVGTIAEVASLPVVAAVAEVPVEAAPVEEAPVDEVAVSEESPAAETAPVVAVVPAIIEGPAGPPGPPGPSGAANVEGTRDYVMKFTASTIGGNSQIFDNGRNVGIGTANPKQRLEVNGNIQIHEQNSNVAGLMMTQASGETGYIMHNRANTLTLGAGSVDRLTIDGDGNVGIGIARPSHPIEMASGAYVSAGGVWTNSSSREKKENIADITPEEALAALVSLEPVRFNYINDGNEEYIGFIAEDVPDLVATADRKSLSTMDIVAVLTKVVQQQQQKIDDLEARLNAQTELR